MKVKNLGYKKKKQKNGRSQVAKEERSEHCVSIIKH